MQYSKMAVAIDQQHHGFKPFSRSQRCRLQSYTHLDHFQELSQTDIFKQPFQVENIHRSVSTPCFSTPANLDEENDSNPRIEIIAGKGAPTVRALVVEVAIAMVSGVEPLPLPTGLGGAYLLRTKAGRNIAVAKPIDEEPLAINNPKGFGGLMMGQPGLKRSVRVGETGIRELAAYLLDHGGFAGVPLTALVKISHVSFHISNSEGTPTTAPSKVASLQRYVEHEFDAGELGSSGFSVASVHRIGIFDVRLLNLDRHAGNILVKKHDPHPSEAAELVPIDHGLCLPEWLDDPYFEWLHWPQAAVPFSETELQYISSLDPLKDANLLRNELPSIGESSVRVLIVCTIFLKQAAEAGLCLADIGEMMSREFCSGEENLSVLETICGKAKASVVDSDDLTITQSTEESEVESEMFQFDDETEEFSNEAEEILEKWPDQMAMPPLAPKPLSAKSVPAKLCDTVLSALYEESGGCNSESDNDDTLLALAEEDDDNGTGGIMRSMSYPIQNYTGNNESGSISFGDMNASDWEMFLESFQKLLPEVLEDTKCCVGLTQRLGTSCKF